MGAVQGGEAWQGGIRGHATEGFQGDLQVHAGRALVSLVTSLGGYAEASRSVVPSWQADSEPRAIPIWATTGVLASGKHMRQPDD